MEKITFEKVKRYLLNGPFYFLPKVLGLITFVLIKIGIINSFPKKINLCSGPLLLSEYYNVDLCYESDLCIDLEKHLLPFRDSSIEHVICISSINYFSKERARKIIQDVYRILRKGGIARFSTQDLELISKRYVSRDANFFFQKLPSGKERFPGETFCDKFNYWFYGYNIKNKNCKFFYDFETLSKLFVESGFSKVDRKEFGESDIEKINIIDNRSDQVFFLEAKK